MGNTSKQKWLEAVNLGETELGYQEWKINQNRNPIESEILSQSDVHEPLEGARKALESGFYDEALLSIGIAQARLSRLQPGPGIIIAPSADGTVMFPDSFTRFEVVDYNLDVPRCYVQSDVIGGEISLQDNGRTAKLFLKRKV